MHLTRNRQFESKGIGRAEMKGRPGQMTGGGLNSRVRWLFFLSNNGTTQSITQIRNDVHFFFLFFGYFSSTRDDAVAR